MNGNQKKQTADRQDAVTRTDVEPTINDKRELLDQCWNALVDGREEELTRLSDVGSDPQLRDEIQLLEKLNNARRDLAGEQPAAAETSAGDQLGDYQLLERIGRGGMGVVFKARQVSLQRIVAVKLLRSGFLATDEEIERFRIETESTARLHHPHIVTLYEIGQQGDILYFAMEFIPGMSLAERVRSHPLPPKDAARYVEIVASAIQYAHQQGIVHRDLKPSNILIDEQDQPRLTDFGLARTFSTMVNADSPPLTATGATVGTPAYMSPEQASGQRESTGPLSDVYSLGAVLYELLSGRPPFQTESPLETLRQVVDAEPASPRVLNQRVPVDLETVCLKCLSKDPDRRYTSANELAEDLRRFQNDQPVVARPIGRITRGLRWCRRNPVITFLTLLAVSSLVAVAAVSVVSQIRISDALADTTEALSKAERQRDVAVAAMNDLVYRVHDDLERREASVAARGEVLQSAMLGLQKIIDSDGDRDDTRSTMADAHNRYAFILSQQSRFEESTQQYLKAIALAESVADEGSKRKLALYHLNLGQHHQRITQFDAGIRPLDTAVEIVDELLQTQPDDAELKELKVRALYLKGGTLLGSNRTHESLELTMQSLALAQTLAEQYPDDPNKRQLLIDINLQIGRTSLNQSQFAMADTHFSKALELLERDSPEASEDVQLRSRYHQALLNLARVQLARMKYEQSHTNALKAIAVLQKLREAEPDRLGFRLKMGSALQHLADVNFALGKLADSRRNLNDTIVLYEPLLDVPEMLVQRMNPAMAAIRLAGLDIRDDQLEQAVNHLRAAAEYLEPLNKDWGTQPMFDAINNMADLVRAAGNQKSAADATDIQRIRRGYSAFRLACDGRLPHGPANEEQLIDDIESTANPILRSLLSEWLAIGFGRSYEHAVASAADAKQLPVLQTKCIEWIRKSEALAGVDPMFHIKEPAFQSIRTRPEFRSALSGQ